MNQQTKYCKKSIVNNLFVQFHLFHSNHGNEVHNRNKIMHNIIMNKLKWAIFKKRRLYNSYNPTNRRKIGKFSENIRRQSVNQYFIERCAGGPKSRDFWSTIKPFLINKGTYVRKKYYTVWKRAGCLVSDQTQVCNTLKVVDCILHDIIVAKLNANVLQIQLQA